MFWILILIKSKIVTAADKEPEETSYIDVFFVLKENRYVKVGSLMVCINIWYFWFLKWSRMTAWKIYSVVFPLTNQVLSNNIPMGIKCRGFFVSLWCLSHFSIHLPVFKVTRTILYYVCKALPVFKTAYNSQFWKRVTVFLLWLFTVQW